MKEKTSKEMFQELRSRIETEVHAYNKHLTKDKIDNRFILELLPLVHPSSREDYTKEYNRILKKYNEEQKEESKEIISNLEA